MNRQVLHSINKINVFKVYSAESTLESLNPFIKVEALNESLGIGHMSILQFYDVILDCLDNFKGRYMLNDMAIKLGKPLISGSVL